MKIFISHAYEDKADFVKPLAEALNEDFEVWYDDYVLTLGDSLLVEINKGLTSCDYGVVVLSHAFFGKQWPQKELDGLFSLETATRKVILPIWKGIDLEGVTGYSPVLAGRLAIDAARGVPEVVSEIKRSIEVSARSQEIVRSDELAKRFKAVDSSIRRLEVAAQLRYSDEGASAVWNSFKTLCSDLQQRLSDIASSVDSLHFTFATPMSHIFEIQAPLGLRFNLHLAASSANSTVDVCLQLTKYQIGKPKPSGEQEPLQQIGKSDYYPDFDVDSSVCWKSNRSSKRMITVNTLGETVLEELVEELERLQ